MILIGLQLEALKPFSVSSLLVSSAISPDSRHTFQLRSHQTDPKHKSTVGGIMVYPVSSDLALDSLRISAPSLPSVMLFTSCQPLWASQTRHLEPSTWQSRSTILTPEAKSSIRKKDQNLLSLYSYRFHCTWNLAKQLLFTCLARVPLQWEKRALSQVFSSIQVEPSQVICFFFNLFNNFFLLLIVIIAFLTPTGTFTRHYL